MKSKFLLFFIVVSFYSCKEDIPRTIYSKDIKSDKFQEIYQLYTLHNTDTIWYPFTFSDSRILVNEDSVKNLSFSTTLDRLNEVLPTFIYRNIKRQKLMSYEFSLQIPNQLLNDFKFEIDKEIYNSKIDYKKLNNLNSKFDTLYYKIKIILEESNLKKSLLKKLTSSPVDIDDLVGYHEEKPAIGYFDSLQNIVSIVENSNEREVKFKNKFEKFTNITILFSINKKL